MKNEPNLNVDEPQDAIKYLKEYCDIDNIEPPWKDKAVFVTCNQPYEWKNNWKKFRKSTLSCCKTIVAKCLNKEKECNQSYGKRI